MSERPILPAGFLPSGQAPFAPASDFAGLRLEIALARRELVNMILYGDRRGHDQQQRVADTAHAVSTHLAAMQAPPGLEGPFRELQDTWTAFKHTRDHELVPALLAGEGARAEHLAAEIQKRRLDRCYALIAELEG